MELAPATSAAAVPVPEMRRNERRVVFMRPNIQPSQDWPPIGLGSRIRGMKTSPFGLCVVLLCLGIALLAQDKIDFTVIEKIRAEGMDRSKAVETFEYLTTNIGPRLTNSPAHKQAIAWTQQQLKAMGMSDVHTEEFQFGRGWTLNKVTIEMVEPRYMPLIGYPRGWSP